jgi:hypothetical protein
MSSETNFAARYREMSETELMHLALAYDDLVHEAQAALRGEFARRGLEPPLIEEEEGPLTDDEAGPVTVGQYRDLPEALVSRAVLEQAGIQSFLSDENTVRMNWTLSNAVGGIRLQVAAEDEAQARELLSQPASQQFVTDSGEQFVQPVCTRCGSTDVMANDHERKVLVGSTPVNITLPHQGVSGAEWRCLHCDAVWVDDEELQEQDGTLR